MLKNATLDAKICEDFAEIWQNKKVARWSNVRKAFASIYFLDMQGRYTVDGFATASRISAFSRAELELLVAEPDVVQRALIRGSFSAGSTPIFASKYAFFCIF